jgi:hypothetical protein
MTLKIWLGLLILIAVVLVGLEKFLKPKIMDKLGWLPKGCFELAEAKSDSCRNTVELLAAFAAVACSVVLLRNGKSLWEIAGFLLLNLLWYFPAWLIIPEIPYYMVLYTGWREKQEGIRNILKKHLGV